MEILIFRTDIHNRTEVEALAPIMDDLPSILRWNVDLHDIDKVLRIESGALCARDVEERLRRAGYYCEELPD